MRGLLFIATCIGAAACFSEEAVKAEMPPPPALPASAEIKPVEGAKPDRPAPRRLTPEERAAMRERMRVEREAHEAAEAGELGISVEELRRRRESERRALRERHDRELAAREGLSLEEFRARREAKKDEMLARRLGVTVEELRGMTPDDRRARLQELRRRHEAERREWREKRAAKAAADASPATPCKSETVGAAKCCVSCRTNSATTCEVRK